MDTVTAYERVFRISQWDDETLHIELKKCGLGLTAEEINNIAAILGRDPTIVECFIFDIEWSEHCSYKSSKEVLKRYLPVEAPNVIQGIEEDAGIIHLAAIGKHNYGLVMAHESHNHPSQVLPVEGAATGIGGIVRDVDCMGAHVVAVADPLRFGDPRGRNKERTKWIAGGVVQGIWEYANALGVPNMGGDVCFNESFDDNCLVNVVAIGIVRADQVIHSRAPRGAGEKKYDVILVGKPTDASGFGGVTFASEILDEEKEEEKKGAVQVHDPFLKNVLLMRKANASVWQLARERGIEIGFKDLGGGGLACASSEIGSAGGYGMDIDLDRVHVSLEGLPPEVIACGETQERYILTVPASITEEVLRIYNEDWDLPNIYEGARASVIGKVTDDRIYTLRYQGQLVCQVPINEVTRGIKCCREAKALKLEMREPDFPEPADLSEVLLVILRSPNVSSREYIYRFYDTEVQGNAVIRPGEADAGVIAPLLEEGSTVGVALATDGNPFYGRINPYWAGAQAVAEAMRNVAAVGAIPSGLTDCLNFGNPEKPEAFWQFVEAVRGLSDAARNLWLKGYENTPVPVVSGNVSFYNESAGGRAVDPSPIIACAGILDDYSKAVTMRLKVPGNSILLIGRRYDELGGSEYYREIFQELGSNVPQVRFEEERGAIYGVIDAINAGLVHACHDISNGGLAVALAEMILGGRANGMIGVEVDLAEIPGTLRRDKKLFSESSGFLLEVSHCNTGKIKELFFSYGVEANYIGKVTEKQALRVMEQDKIVLELSIAEMRRAWTEGTVDAMK